MPNWTENDLTITGNEEDLKKLKEFVTTKKETLLDFEKIIPFPQKVYDDEKEIRKMEELKGNEKKNAEIIQALKEKTEFNSHDWCISNWGTKWNSCRAEIIKEDKNHLVYTFETAWSPPLPVIVKLSSLFPTLKFLLEYYERGNGFCGKLEIDKVKIIQDVYSDKYRGNRGG